MAFLNCTWLPSSSSTIPSLLSTPSHEKHRIFWTQSLLEVFKDSMLIHIPKLLCRQFFFLFCFLPGMLFSLPSGLVPVFEAWVLWRWSSPLEGFSFCASVEAGLQSVKNRMIAFWVSFSYAPTCKPSQDPVSFNYQFSSNVIFIK